jgi:hypothetical protein
VGALYKQAPSPVIGVNPEMPTGIHLIPGEYLFALQLPAEVCRKTGHYGLRKTRI